MNFDFSVGDFLTAIELANRIRSRFVDAPDQFGAISDEVKSLSNVLRDVDDVLPQRDLSDQQKTEFSELIQSCQELLKELEKTLDEYQELDPNTKGFAGRSRRVWKKLRWNQKTIDGFRSRITSNVLLLNTFLGRITSRTTFATKEGVDLIAYKHDQDRQAILDWLTPFDYAPQQSDFISRRQEGTGQWLLTSNQFRNWVDQSNQSLFCAGIPGAGKTISTAIVIDKLYTQFQSNSSVAIAYVYCNFRRQHEQKPIDLLASLLKQLIQGLLSVPQNIHRLYEHHQHKRTRPSIDEVSQALQSVIRNYSKAFVIIDALDECQVSDGRRKRFTRELFNLQAASGANLFVTSRFIPDIVKDFDRKGTWLEIRASDEDLQRYLDGHMLKLPPFVSRSADLQREIKTAIVKAVDGIFLLAQLHLDSLIGKRSPKALRYALEKLVKGSEAYDQAYHEAMERIEGQVTDSTMLAKQVLSWIICAKRPLTTLELQHALAVEVGESELDKDNLPEIEDMISVCAGLVTVDEESNIIRLVHYTTQEFFERTRQDWFPEAATDITATCVTYLSFNVFESGFCPTDKEFEERLRLNPFYDYAARNWGHHARIASVESKHFILDFLESCAKVSASSQALMASKPSTLGPAYHQTMPEQIRAVHLAAYFGLESVTASLLKTGHNPNSKDARGRTPLSWAAENGYKALLKFLLAQDGVDPDSKDNNDWTPLSWAAQNGHEAAVKLLLEEKVEPNSKDKNGLNPLHWAARNGHEVIVEILIRAGADIDLADGRGSTALHESIRSNHQAVQELLIGWGANLDVKDNHKQTASDLAWSKKQINLSAYLVDKDLTAGIKQGAQAHCEILRRKSKGDIPLSLFCKRFSTDAAVGSQVRKYLLREHKILQRLNHPFIVSYLGYKEDPSQRTAALYLEYCEGGDLGRWRTQRPDHEDDSDDSTSENADPSGDAALLHPVPLGEDEVWSTVFQLAAALAYLHHGLSIKGNGEFSFEKYWEPVIHRDVKPDNVVIKEVEVGVKVIKLCDLGLVKAVMNEKYATQNIGTPNYSPPEAQRKGWTMKGDIYSLGWTIHDLIAFVPKTELPTLLERCKSTAPNLRPSSLSILEIARGYIAGYSGKLSLSLHRLLGSGSGGYLLESLVKIASGVDEYTAFGDETTRQRRGKILARLKLLCHDGAEELFDQHSKSLHLSILLDRQDKLKSLLNSGQHIDINEKWEKSGWTPLHLAFQEGRLDMAIVLIKHGADREIVDRYMRRSEFYGRL